MQVFSLYYILGASETIAGIFGLGILAYFTYKVILPKLQEGGFQMPDFQLPQLQQPAAAQEPSPPPASPSLPPNTKTKEKKEPIITPTNSDMTSPNVAGTSFTFNVVGDVDHTPATAVNLCSSNPTLVMIIGDFAYDCNAQAWWTQTMKPCNGKNVVGSVGNHDCNGKGFLELFPANGGKWTHIKKIGNIAFVALNTGFCDAICSNPATEEPVIKQAQADPTVKFIVVHFHKPIFTSGTAPDTPMSFHTMLKKYPKVKMAFAGHNHSYKRYVPIDGIQYITAGRGGHDATGKEPLQKGASSNNVGVVKCRVSSDGGITCQYVGNNGTVLDQWGLTASGKHTGTGGVTPKQGTGSAESGYVQSFYTAVDQSGYDFKDKEERDNAVIAMMDRHELRLKPMRKFNNTIYHYSKWVR